MKIKLKNVCKCYSNSQKDALHDVTIEFPEKGMFFVLGNSGSGKTTLINILSGLDVPTQGEMYINEQVFSQLSEMDWDNYRNGNIGIIFQEYNIFPELTVEENIELALSIQDMEDSCVEEKLANALREFRIEQYKNTKVSNLSGGEKQRVAIARCMAKDVNVILADEPTGNLDSENAEIVFECLKRVAATRLVIVISHNREAANKYADSILRLNDGVIVGIEESVGKKGVVRVFLANGRSLSIEEWLAMPYSAMAECANSDGVVGTIILENCVDEKKIEEQVPVRNVRPIEMSWGWKVRLARLWLLTKKAKFLLVFFMLSLVSMFFILLLSVLNNQFPKVIAEYFDGTTEPYVAMERVSESLNDRVNNQQGKVAWTEYSNCFGTEQLLLAQKNRELSIYSYEQKEMMTEDGEYIDDQYVMAIVCPSDYEVCAYGRMPLNGNEIAITDYVAKRMNISMGEIGQVLYLDDVPMSLCGVVKTGFEERETEYVLLEYEQEYFYETIFVSEKYWDTLAASKTEYLQLPSSDIAKSMFATDFATSYANYSSSDLLEEDDIIGERPKRTNEVLISLQYAEKMHIEYDNGEFEMQTVNMRGIKENKLYDYSSCFDICEFLGNEIKVVGLVRNAYFDIYVMDEVYGELQEHYCKYYMYDTVLVRKEAFTEKNSAKVLESKFVFMSPDMGNVMYGIEEREEMKPYLGGLIVVFALLAICLVNVFIILNVRDNHREIGIMRSMGVARKDVMKVLTIEAAWLAVLSCFLGIVGDCAAYQFIHFHFEKQLIWKQYINVWIPNVIVIVGASIVLFASILLFTMFSSMKLSKRRIITLLKME